MAKHVCGYAQLLELLERHAMQPEIVLLAAPALARVLMGAQQATMASMERRDGLSLLAAVVTRQAQAQPAVQVGLEHQCMIICKYTVCGKHPESLYCLETPRTAQEGRHLVVCSTCFAFARVFLGSTMLNAVVALDDARVPFT